MKPKHRHELKTNELAEWLANFPQWAKENLRMIIYVSVVVVLVAGAYFWKRYEKTVVAAQKQFELTNLITQLPRRKMQIIQAQAQGRDYSFMLLQTAQNLQGVAQNANDDQMAALALIKQAEALRAELHYRPGTVGKQDVEAAINQAKASYTEAIKKSSTNPSLMAIAKFGLGLCEEEAGNFEQAEKIYREISTDAGFEGTTAAAQAKHRLNTIADYQRKVVFRATPKQAPPKVIQPQVEVKAHEAPQSQNDTFEVSDSNLPLMKR